MNRKRSSFSGKLGFRPVGGGRVRRTWKHLAFPLSRCKVWRGNLSTRLYHSGTDLWLHDDRGGNCSRPHDQKESGGCL